MTQRSPSDFFGLMCLAGICLGLISPVQAEKILTIKSPAGEKTITVQEDPVVSMRYTPGGLVLEFENLAITTVCIEDPSTSQGLCRLQAYDASIPDNSPQVGVPGPPANVTTTAGDGSATVSWTAPNDNGGADLSGYRLQVAAENSSSFETIVASTGSVNTSRVVTGLTNGNAIKVRVAAINSEGVGYYSGASNTVTPQSSGNSPGSAPSGYATACNNVPANVDCNFLFDGDLTTGGLQYVDIRAGKIYSVPFKVPDQELTNALKVFSFTDELGSSFVVWYSETAGAEDYPGMTAACESVRGSANGKLFWTTDPAQASAACSLDDNGVIYANFKHVRNSDGALRAYDSLKIEVLD